MSTANWPDGFAHRSSAAFVNSTGRGAHSATRQFWSNGSFDGSSLNALKLPQNQCGNDVLIRRTVSAFESSCRLGPVPPQPAWFGITTAIRSSNAPASSAVLPSREWPTMMIRAASMSGSVTR